MNAARTNFPNWLNSRNPPLSVSTIVPSSERPTVTRCNVSPCRQLRGSRERLDLLDVVLRFRSHVPGHDPTVHDYLRHHVCYILVLHDGAADRLLRWLGAEIHRYKCDKESYCRRL